LAQEPAKYESLLASAQQAQARGEFEAAADFYQQAAGIHPEIAELKANLGLMYYQTNKSEQAADAFRQAIRLKPELFVPNLFLGLDFVKLKRYRDAIPFLEHAARSKPDNVHVQVGLGRAYAGLGDTRRAIRSYSTATQIDPASADAWYRLGVSYLEQVESDARTLVAQHRSSEYMQALIAENFAERGAFIQAAQSYEKVLSSKSFPPGTHSDYALLLLAQHDLPDAEKELKAELAENPGSLMAKLGQARLEVEQGSFESGARSIATIWNADAGFVRSNVEQFKLGITRANTTALQDTLERLRASGEIGEDAASLFSDATEHVTVAVGGRPKSGDSTISNDVHGDGAKSYREGAYGRCRDRLASRLSTLSSVDLRLLAVCAFSTGDYGHAFDAGQRLSAYAETEAVGMYWETRSSEKLAADALAKASERDSGSAKLHVLLGDVYRQRKHPSEATREYQKALMLQAKDPGALFGLSLALLADGHVDEALHTAQGALKDYPDDPELNAVMGEILCQREDFVEAERFLKRSANTKPEYSSQVHALLGKVYANTNRTEEAIAELKLALPEDKNGHLYYQIGRLYLKVGNRDLAQRAFLESKRLERESLTRPAPDFDKDQGGNQSR
jgi:tetratricopeptide (TPR) repeat protein